MSRRAIPLQFFVGSFLLVSLLVVGVAIGSVWLHQRAMRDLIVERDGHSVQVLANLLDQNSALPLIELPHATALFIVDETGEIIYQQGRLHGEHVDLAQHAGVVEAQAGRSGALLAPAEDGEHVIAYAPIPSQGWSLIMEESLADVLDTRLNTTLLAPLLVVPLIGLAVGVLWFGNREIVRPLQRLSAEATALGNGDFNALSQQVGGIDEIRKLQTELAAMAGRVERAQRSLRDYAGAVTLGQEEERKRLARELHDDTIQSLLVINQRVQLAQYECTEPDVAAELATTHQQIAAMIADVRRFITALRPTYLEELGLVPSLQTLAQEKQAAWGIPVHFALHGDERRLSDTVELALFRIVQEGLRNIERHAGASEVWIGVAFSAEDTTFTLRDNGHGFAVPMTPAEMALQGHYGLVGIFERAGMVGAEVALSADNEQGTVITVSYVEGTHAANPASMRP